MNKAEETIEKVSYYLKRLLLENPDFTGNVKINFHDGNAVNANKTESTLFDKKD